MKKRPKKTNFGFFRMLVKHCLELKRLKPNDVCIFNVIAKHGSYQIHVGPELSPKECKNLGVKEHSRSIEINGSMHNLFINPHHISPTPRQEDLRTNLRGSVIMRNIVIHIVDQNGSGSHVRIEGFPSREIIKAETKINLAGEKGEEMIEKLNANGHLADEAYKIVQEDILKSMKSHR